MPCGGSKLVRKICWKVRADVWGGWRPHGRIRNGIRNGVRQAMKDAAILTPFLEL